MPRLDFWLEFASTYTYLSAMRIGALADAAGVTVRWRPFLLGAVFRTLELPTDSPFNWQHDKGRHMWRDMERMCQAYDLPLVRPEPFPQPSLSAARIATAIAQDESAAPDAVAGFSRTVFHAEYGQGRAIGDAEVLADCLRSSGLSGAYLEAAGTQPVKDALRAETETAMAAGVFGAPSFVTAGGELFWGNDRLEQAVAWAVRESA